MGDLTRSPESLGQSYPTRRQLRFKIEHQKARVLAERHRKVQRALSAQIDDPDLEKKVVQLSQHYEHLLQEREQGFRLASHACVSRTKGVDAEEDNAQLRWRHLTERFLVEMERKVKEAGLKRRGPEAGSAQHAQEVWRGKMMDQRRRHVKIAVAAPEQKLRLRNIKSGFATSGNSAPALMSPSPPSSGHQPVRRVLSKQLDSSMDRRNTLENDGAKIIYQSRPVTRIRHQLSDPDAKLAQRAASSMSVQDFEEMEAAWGSLKDEDWRDDEVGTEDNAEVEDQPRRKSEMKLERLSNAEAKEKMWESVHGLVRGKGSGG